jgi:copper resistance protein B
MQGGAAPANARDPHAYSGGYALDSGPYALAGERQLRLADEHHFWSFVADRLESQNSDSPRQSVYDVQAWYGSTYDKLTLKSEGGVLNGRVSEGSTDLLWSHAVSPFWDTQLGARLDQGQGGPNRTWLAFGIQGLAPYWFEVEATAYIGSGGRTALTLQTEYDLLLTQRLILQPRVEVNFYGKQDTAAAIGSGLSDGAVGLRLRYEFGRKLAPYVGVEWDSKFGTSADMARASGEDATETRFVAGVRLWF